MASLGLLVEKGRAEGKVYDVGRSFAWDYPAQKFNKKEKKRWSKKKGDDFHVNLKEEEGEEQAMRNKEKATAGKGEKNDVFHVSNDVTLSLEGGGVEAGSPPTDQDSEIEQKKEAAAKTNMEEAAKALGWTKQIVYIFSEVMKQGELILDVYAVNSSSVSPYEVTSFPLRHWYNMGYVAHGSKLYAIGGCNIRSDSGYSRNVFICDLSKKKLGGEHKWKKGPLLNAIKPSPMVVQVKGKIYALAGDTYFHGPGRPETVEPVFEVLDPQKRAWCKLTEPPFLSYYNSCGPVLLSHTVIGNIIYVRVNNPVDPDLRWVDEFYSFNVDDGNWNELTPGASVYGNSKGDNLKNFFWDGRADVADGKLYTCSTTSRGYLTLYAYDLTTKKEEVVENMMGQTSVAASSTIHDGDTLYWDVVSDPDFSHYGVPFIKLPVKLLTYFRSSTLVAHLGNRMLLVVCAYNSPRNYPYGQRLVYTCLLKLMMEENISNARGSQTLRDCALVVKQEYFRAGNTTLSLGAWSTK
ncbi:hypothetical protein RHGRI_029092 [Rhododendron griersonianum]|uniref:Kelch repeat type 1 n=1 Tax=Rhododendron griersonianum TaxID=479676 RepID=A0AAV6IHZ6_9ERIC|nr:hypothetical protein RHGRI_029092 [Rhododendron griersonianum]